MFNTAGVRSMWRGFSALANVSLATLLGACAHQVPPDNAGPENWVVQSVKSKSTAELYEKVILPATFKSTNTKVIGSYTVDSGNMSMPNGSLGSLVTVRSADGSLTALVDRQGKRGLLNVSNNGIATFKPDSYLGPEINDSVPYSQEQSITAPVGSSNEEPRIVDVLIGFSKAAVQAAGGDAYAFALAQVELVNLYLRNSKVLTVSIRLAGVQVVENNYGVNSLSLSRVPSIFAEGETLIQPDLIAGFFVTEPGDTNDGVANYGHRFSVQAPTGRAVFVHELGHNAKASGGHCDNANATFYNFGSDNGKSRTIMCGSWYATMPYFSNPAIKDQYGLPIGDPAKADMARVWRENAQRLSSYAPPSPYADLSASIIGPSSDRDYSITCPKGTVISGRGHEGLTNSGLSNYFCLLPKLGSLTVKPLLGVWMPWGNADHSCQPHMVLSGVEQKGDQVRIRCTHLLDSDKGVLVRNVGTHEGFQEENHQFTCPMGQYITSIRSTGTSKEFKTYNCAILEFSSRP